MNTRTLNACSTLVWFLTCSVVWGQQASEITYRSAADDSLQPAMYFAPPSEAKVPLVVVLHSWSGDYKQQLHAAIETWCIQKRWAYIHPNFRGKNSRPEATGSSLVVEDIASAVEFVCDSRAIDRDAIYLVGTSGGGYTALLMAGRKPDLWAGVSAWVPISDLRAWYFECKATNRRYFKEIALSCGGPPGSSDEVDRQYQTRSPITHLANAKDVRIHIHTGIRDGHEGSVPISHSLRAFNVLAAPQDRIAQSDIQQMVKKATIPERLRREVDDPSYGENKPLFRRTSNKATVTIFDGGHELVSAAAIAWVDAVHQDSKASR